MSLYQKINQSKKNEEEKKLVEKTLLQKGVEFVQSTPRVVAEEIAGGAETILLDEPTAGMSKSETERATNLIRSIAKNRTVLIVEHDMGVVFDLSDTISVLVYGEVICSDKPENVKTNKLGSFPFSI